MAIVMHSKQNFQSKRTKIKIKRKIRKRREAKVKNAQVMKRVHIKTEIKMTSTQISM